jgi:hypothetical protein
MLEQKRKVSPLMCVAGLQLSCIPVMHVGRRKASESIENVDLTINARPIRTMVFGGPKASAVPPAARLAAWARRK